MQAIDDYIKRVKHLPPAPVILPRLLVLLGQPDQDTRQVVSLITYDPALTASVLQLCNSAYFGAASRITDIADAVNLLGFNQIFRLVAVVCGARALLPAQKAYGLARGELWKHSVTAAIAAQCLAEDLDGDTNGVFTAALLHDLGKIILAEALEQTYADLVRETETHQLSLLETEKKLLGAHHAEVGAQLLANWKFPPALVAAVAHHHQPEGARPHERLASYVYLGNLIAHFMGFSFGHQALAFRGREEALHILELHADRIPQYMIQTFERLEEIEKLVRHTT